MLSITTTARDNARPCEAANRFGETGHAAGLPGRRLEQLLRQAPLAEVRVARDIVSREIFPPHGDYHARAFPNLYLSEMTGPFNSELLKRYSKLVMPLVRMTQAATGQFVIISTFYESMMMPPEALQQVCELMASQAVHGGLKAVAHIADARVEGRDLIASQFRKRVASSTGLPYRLFEDQSDALDWLNDYVMAMPDVKPLD